jgi:amino acid transporter
LGFECGMSDPSTSFLLRAVLAVTGLVAIVGYVWWQMRNYRRGEFSVLRVLGVTFAAACCSLLFVAGWWWLEPRGTGHHDPLLLAAVFVPIAALEVWGFVIGRRELKRKKT